MPVTVFLADTPCTRSGRLQEDGAPTRDATTTALRVTLMARHGFGQAVPGSA
ncbi:hypothetical protein [Streptomyces sp. NPDC002133]|uniref:hypothetical protein n=1 Tax=Streptomyces sp. NPDC002133 TaxID=3154409 RepID=UPI0033194A7D